MGVHVPMSSLQSPSLSLGNVPTAGRFSVKVWALSILDCTEETLNDWIEKHGIR